ncbi:ATPase family AAA domain-containing protein 3-B [Tripterygium wilfordii]|uniref:ATPase family AAA domain-containing protein 3-B n=1 Tax=Tripterygium wilfordii TaxID=458696 RepID=A0A7J7CMY0_TRIWF|nr:ATPase family AAA domain-containing protein 3-like [Tripterygium wilfordii]KAF5735424.1 ATPase family AAA domain-containing protein 3-B [Tripterygium wilfordii]
MANTYAMGLISALAASASLSSQSNFASADGPFNFSPFSSSSSPPAGPPSNVPQSYSADKSRPANSAPSSAEPEPRVRNDNPRTSSSGFDPEALERGVKALEKIEASSQPKKIFEIMRKQEETKQAELAAKAAEFKAMQAQAETERQRVIYDEQKKLAQHQAQTKSQMARYEDELARKRMQAENELQRARNQELVKLQEESSIRQEQARRAVEEQIQAQRRQTEREKADLERETIRIRSMAEAEGRAHEAKLSEDVNRRKLIDQANAEREKWVAAINTTFDHIGGGLKAILTDQNKLVVAVGGVTALAAGIYTTREGAKVIWSYVDRILGQPTLIRESSIGKYPWSGIFSRRMSSLSHGAGKESASKNGNGFGDVILHPSLQKRIQHLAGATANTKSHQAPFRNMLFYGPPGTGKTMAAREMAQKSGLDYALMTGGDVAPLGSQAVTKIHQLFDWAKKSKRGLLLFIDEADAFLCERNKAYMSEAQRSALNALLFRTGDQSKDIVLALATNRPGDLDSAVADRIDEVLEFPLPGQEERVKLLKLYLDKYIAQAGSGKSGLFQRLFKRNQQKIEIKGLTDEILMEAAARTEGFSGREIAKLMASVQAAVYGSENCVLDASLFREVVDYKVAEHQQRKKLGVAGGGSN